jgi:phosphoribosylglycinamide formyltransferase-1
MVIFASGAGTNALRIIEYFKASPLARVALVVCNNPRAGVIGVAGDHGIPVRMVGRDLVEDTAQLTRELVLLPADLIVLAGFLLKIPRELLQAFPEKIINIHPALLPKYGGRSMYGHHVHDAVLRAGETESGITIHRVNEQYDEGSPIFQKRVPVVPGDTPLSLAQKVQQLEHEWYPKVIEELLKN